MKALGIHTGRDLRDRPLEFLQRHFGKSGPYFYGVARGIDNRAVRPDRIRKSIGAEDTFSIDLTTFEAMMAETRLLVDKVWRYCEKSGVRGRTVTLKLRYADFETITRSRTMPGMIDARDEIERVAGGLLQALFPMEKGVRLLGVTLASLNTEPEADSTQMRLAL